MHSNDKLIKLNVFRTMTGVLDGTGGALLVYDKETGIPPEHFSAYEATSFAMAASEDEKQYADIMRLVFEQVHDDKKVRFVAFYVTDAQAIHDNMEEFNFGGYAVLEHDRTPEFEEFYAMVKEASELDLYEDAADYLSAYRGGLVGEAFRKAAAGEPTAIFIDKGFVTVLPMGEFIDTLKGTINELVISDNGDELSERNMLVAMRAREMVHLICMSNEFYAELRKSAGVKL